jgi:hypothetical protein
MSRSAMSGAICIFFVIRSFTVADSLYVSGVWGINYRDIKRTRKPVNRRRMLDPNINMFSALVVHFDFPDFGGIFNSLYMIRLL